MAYTSSSRSLSLSCWLEFDPVMGTNVAALDKVCWPRNECTWCSLLLLLLAGAKRHLVTPADLALGLLWTLATGHPDAALLAAYADSAHVPHTVVWAIAWQESRHNLNPAVRGRAGEIGRLQVLPRTAKTFCADLDIYTYSGNVKCGVRLLRGHFQRRGSWAAAIRAYQCPTCTRDTPYQRSVLERVGRIELRLKELRS